jgi:hypothetical protein
MQKGQAIRYDVNSRDPLDDETDRQTAARWRRWFEREEAIEANAAAARSSKSLAPPEVVR